MSQIAFLFPGQGSQYPGMGRQLAEAYPLAAATFRDADQALGFPLSRLCFEGPEAELQRTANTQPAVLAVDVAAGRVLMEQGLRPDFVAGHSLGEYAALVLAGGMDFKDAIRTVRRRGELMQSAVPEGQGAMAAILGLDAESVTALCAEAAAGQVCSPANFNAPGQTVIAGDAAAVSRAIALAEARQARAVPLPVSAPFHCALMLPAAEALEGDLWNTLFCELEIPLINNVDAEPIEGAEEARDALIRQVASPVQWEKAMRWLLARGVETFIEAGPGRVLSGLLKRLDRSKTILAADTPEGVAAAVAAAR